MLDQQQQLGEIIYKEWNMKVYTSYFYQIRNFAPYQIPVSTAAWDPKWYHANKGNDNVFIDRNGVINGIRIGALQPNKSLHGLCQGAASCTCKSEQCAFLKGYEAQLLELDFNKIWDNLNKLAEVVKDTLEFKEEPEVVLIVYETPDNRCSERQAIQKLFSINGISCEEIHFR